MLLTYLKRWQSRLFLMRISKWVILATFSVSVIVAGLTVYADNVGNFVITVGDAGGTALTLSETEDFKKGNVILFGPGVNNLNNATYVNIPEYELLTHEGDHSNYRERTYLGYSFFLMNTADVPVDYRMTFVINEVYRRLDHAIRINLIRCEKDSLGEWQAVDNEILARRERDGSMYDNTIRHDLNPRPYEVTEFYNNATPAVRDNRQFGVKSVHKYVVIMWLEGNDPDCIDDILNGSIRLSMDFAVTSVYE